MPKMIGGRIACRVSYAPDGYGSQFYCDHCGKYFDDRHEPPCEQRLEDRYEIDSTLEGITRAIDRNREIMTNAIEAIGEKKITGPAVDELDRGVVPEDAEEIVEEINKIVRHHRKKR